MLRSSLMLNRGTPQRIANGPDLIRAGDAVRRAEKNRDAWPFPHVYPPVNSIRRNPMGYCLAPAAAAQAVILSWTVPSGFWFYMKFLGLYYSGETAAPGAFLLTLDRNTPLGVAGLGSVSTDLQSVPFPMGSFEHGPVELPRTELFAPEDWIQAKVYNVSVTPGTPNSFGAYFGGWLVPTIEVPDAQ
jgi:hypothetical protein